MEFSFLEPLPVLEAGLLVPDAIVGACGNNRNPFPINFDAFQRVSGTFVADSMATPARTVTGVASFYQNPFTGQNSKYKITLNGLTTGSSYYIGLGTTSDCSSVTGEVVSDLMIVTL